MFKNINILLVLLLFILTSEKALTLEYDEIIKRIHAIIDDKDFPLLAGGLAVIKDNKTLFCKSIGKARLNKDGTENKTSNEYVKYFTASISKLFTAVAIWQLDEKGLLKVTDEASKYLNFNLTNKNFPETPITIEMLLSHTSSIREYGHSPEIPYNHHISEFFINGSELYNNGSYSEINGPGYFEYGNIDYCLLGTIIENVTNQRFDLYMIDNVLTPLNITGSFNIYEMPIETLDEVGTLYSKLTNGNYDINGNWTPMIDDFSDGYPEANYSEYVIGTNGALFGPMGHLRISLTELTHLVYMFLNNGTYNNETILKPETVEKMFKIIWKYDETKNNGNNLFGYFYAFTRGLTTITNIGKNRLHKTKNLNFSGRTGLANGLFGGLFVDRAKGYGVVYRGNGISVNIFEHSYDFSAFEKWAIDFIKLADDIAQFDYPEIDDGNNGNDNDNDNSYIIYIIIPVIIVIIIIIIAIFIYKKKNKEDTGNNQEEKQELMFKSGDNS